MPLDRLSDGMLRRARKWDEAQHPRAADGKFSDSATIAGNYERIGMPLKGHHFHNKTDSSLMYIMKDASEAAHNMTQMGSNPQKIGKYLDEANDAATVLAYRKREGLLGKVQEPKRVDWGSTEQMFDKVLHPK